MGSTSWNARFMVGRSRDGVEDGAFAGAPAAGRILRRGLHVSHVELPAATRGRGPVQGPVGGDVRRGDDCIGTAAGTAACVALVACPPVLLEC